VTKIIDFLDNIQKMNKCSHKPFFFLILNTQRFGDWILFPFSGKSLLISVQSIKLPLSWDLNEESEGKNSGGIDRGPIKILSRNFPGGPEKTTKRPSHDIRCPGQDSKLMSPEYQSRALPLCQPAQ
jgi:hypothetical protein